MAAISAFRVTQHSQTFHFSLEIEFNALRFINYTIPRLCSTYAVATIDNYLKTLDELSLKKVKRNPSSIGFRLVMGKESVHLKLQLSLQRLPE